ncbi:MAG: hypothetical protein Q8P80_00670 [Candidatus Levybacteria bacterium]|nr:hypothetical protein [Candidatus Levybacteria bacterium]
MTVRENEARGILNVKARGSEKIQPQLIENLASKIEKFSKEGGSTLYLTYPQRSMPYEQLTIIENPQKDCQIVLKVMGSEDADLISTPKKLMIKLLDRRAGLLKRALFTFGYAGQIGVDFDEDKVLNPEQIEAVQKEELVTQANPPSIPQWFNTHFLEEVSEALVGGMINQELQDKAVRYLMREEKGEIVPQMIEELSFLPKTRESELLKMLYEDSPRGFYVGAEVLNFGGITAKGGRSIERSKEGRTEVLERTFDTSMLAHNVGVCRASNAIADLINLNQEGKDLLTAASLSHDASKRIEVNMMGYRQLSEERRVTAEAQEVLDESFVFALVGKEEAEKIKTEMVNPGAVDFTRYFDQRVNDPFFQRALSRVGSHFSSWEREDIVEIAGASSMSGLPKILAWTLNLAKNLPIDSPKDSVIDNFKEFAGKLEDEKKLPEVDMDTAEYLGLVLWYAEAIAKGGEIVTIEDRYDEVIQRGAYENLHEESQAFYNGMKYFEVCKFVNHVIERIFFRQGIFQGNISKNTIPEDLPHLVSDNLKQRVDKRLKKEDFS